MSQAFAALPIPLDTRTTSKGNARMPSTIPAQAARPTMQWRTIPRHRVTDVTIMPTGDCGRAP